MSIYGQPINASGRLQLRAARTNGAVGKTQYVQIVNEGYQVFDKSSGASVLGPHSISSIWAGFSGSCATLGSGDPVVLYINWQIAG